MVCRGFGEFSLGGGVLVVDVQSGGAVADGKTTGVENLLDVFGIADSDSAVLLNRNFQVSVFNGRVGSEFLNGSSKKGSRNASM